MRLFMTTQYVVLLSHCAVAALASGMSAPAAAQSATPSVVVVSVAALPAGLGIDPDRLPYTVQRATEANRRDSGIDEVSEFMARRLAGVNVNEVQGNALQNDLSFRGFRLSPTLGAAQGMSVYLDGVRANEPFGDVMNWDMLPQAAIADVMLVAGANPLFGLNTLGGTLAFTTKSGRSQQGASADISLASHDRKRIDLSWGGKRDDGWHGFVAGTLFDEAGWRAHSGGGLGNLFAKVGRYDSATDWDLSLLHGRSQLRGNGLLPTYGAAAYTYPDITRNRLTQLTLNLRHAVDDDSELALTAYLRGSRRDTVNGDVNADYSDYIDACADGFDSAGQALSAGCSIDRATAFALHSAALNTSVTHQRSAGTTLNFTRESQGHQFLLGTALDASKVDYRQSAQDGWFTADRGAIADPQSPDLQTAAVDGRSVALGIYASDTWQLRRDTFLTMSGRFNRTVVSNTIAGQTPERFAYNRFNPAIGLVQQVGSGVSLFANLADSNRVPTVIELGCADPQQPCRLPVGLQSDPYLKQVVSRTVEAGLRWQSSPSVSASASLYRSINRDDILFFTAGASQQGYFANFERTRRQGLDLSAKIRRGAVDTALSYSYLEATYDANGILFAGQRNVLVAPGTPIAGLPRHTFKLDVDWHASPRTTLGADIVAVSSMATQGNEDGLSVDPVAGAAAQRADWSIRGHATLDLHGSYRTQKGWEVFGRITNLFDRRYETWGAVARDLFPGGTLLQPHVAAGDAGDTSNTRFVAPGAPRAITIGLRYRM
jgi:outer membrane receptor protein involved in Fe transport